jgi:coenzyme F420-reducing hydrogenase delta subunit
MNERIKNFYDQVGIDFENFQRVTVTKGDMEKFAELIIRECADIATIHQHEWDTAGSYVLKHFGVEK